MHTDLIPLNQNMKSKTNKRRNYQFQTMSRMKTNISNLRIWTFKSSSKSEIEQESEEKDKLGFRI